MQRDCFQCDRNQVKKICQILNLTKSEEIHLLEIADDYLDQCDKRMTNPEVMGDLWKIITKEIDNANPYKDIKSEFNNLVLSIEDELRDQIDKSKYPFQTVLKVAIAANLIDFASKHPFTKDDVKELLLNHQDLQLSRDDSLELEKEILKAKQILYIGDNCGEIVVDKLCIEYIKKMNNKAILYYGVRGEPIVNDVTREDAQQVGMYDIAKVIENGTYTLGTVLSKTSQEFQTLFHDSDVIICKGQGNYEGLIHETKENLFFLFMAKCEVIAQPLGIQTTSIVCMKKNV